MRPTFRLMLANRGLFGLVVLSLGLGIGAAAVAFSLVNIIFFRSLSISEPEQLMSLRLRSPTGSETSIHSYPLFDALRPGNAAVAGFIARGSTPVTLMRGEVGERVDAELVSDNYFDLLGVRPAVGRLLTTGDELRGAGQGVCVISQRLWRRLFDSSPEAVGQMLRVAGVLVEVVGVAPELFYGVEQGGRPDIWAPVTLAGTFMAEQIDMLEDGVRWLWLLGRLRPGYTLEQGQASLQAVADAHAGRNPAAVLLVEASQGLATLRYSYGQQLQVFMGVVSLMLMVALANAMLLLLSRALARARDVATSIALGARRSRIYRDFVFEGVVVGALGGVVGLVFAYWAVGRVVGLLPLEISFFVRDALWDWRALAFVAAVSAGSGVVLHTGLGLAATSYSGNVSAVLAGRETSGPRRRLRQVLVASQAALLLVLVMCALLFIQTLHELQTLDIGFEPDGVVTARLDASALDGNDVGIRLFYQEFLRRVGSDTAAIDDVSLATVSPLSGQSMAQGVDVPEYEGTEEARGHYFNRVTPGYFSTLGIPLRLGRILGPEDDIGARAVAIVNEQMVHRYWPEENPIGKTIRIGRDVEVVGVVGDSQYQNLRETDPLIIYTPFWQGYPAPVVNVLARATLETDTAIELMLRDARATNSGASMYNMRTMDEQIDRLLVRERLLATVSTWLGVAALVLATCGLFGNVAYSVKRRAREIAIRRALGASRSRILGLFLGDTGRTVAVGGLIGAGSFLAAGRVLGNLLFGVQATNPLLILTVASVLAVVAVVGALGPVLFASRGELAAGLRQE